MKNRVQKFAASKKNAILTALILVIYILVSGYGANAQITIGDGHRINIGDSFRVRSVDTTGISEGNSGVNNVWNFSNITTIGLPTDISYIDPQNAPGSNLFPNATLAQKVDESYSYVKQVAGDFFNMGNYMEGTGMTIYQDLQKSFQYPFAYNNTFTDSYRSTTNGEGFVIHSSGTVTTTADAWGTIILPSGSYNALRIKSVTNNIDSMFFSGNVMVNTSINTGYSWYISNLKVPAFSIVYLQGSFFNLKSASVADLTSTGINDPVGLAESFELGQNYPNPFNPSTKIEFSLSKPGAVSLKVYDIGGKEVATLANQYYREGKHSVSFNGAELTSGTYFYKLEVNGIVQTKKMTLVK